MAIKACVVCGGEFEAPRNWSKYCSEKCLKQQHNERGRQWRLKNPKKTKEIQARHYAQNTQKVLDCNNRWRSKNPAKARQYTARWRAKNLEKVRQQRVIWSKNNPDKVSAQKQRHYTKRAAALRLIKEIETNGIGALL